MRKPTEAQLNPDHLERTVPMRPLGKESKYAYRLRALLRYKTLHGDMLVPKMLHVPWSQDWPQEFWGLWLGKVVDYIRNGGGHDDERKELEAEGFDFNKQAVGGEKDSSCSSTVTGRLTRSSTNTGSET